MSEVNQNDKDLEKEIERFKKATGLRDREETLAGKFEDALMKFSEIETEDLLSFLQEACGEDSPDLEELKNTILEEEKNC